MENENQNNNLEITLTGVDVIFEKTVHKKNAKGEKEERFTTTFKNISPEDSQALLERVFYFYTETAPQDDTLPKYTSENEDISNNNSINESNFQSAISGFGHPFLDESKDSIDMSGINPNYASQDANQG